MKNKLDLGDQNWTCALYLLIDGIRDQVEELIKQQVQYSVWIQVQNQIWERVENQIWESLEKDTAL